MTGLRRTGDPWTRLKDELQSGQYQIVSESTTVEEAQPEGRAVLRCALPAGVQAIRWNIEGRTLFPVLKTGEAADGAVLVQAADGTWALHLLELKRSVHEVEFSKAKRQLGCSLVRVLSLCGVLGIEINRLRCYIAYREDKLDPAATADMALLQLPLGDDSSGYTISDWCREQIALKGVADLVPLKKVQLDLGSGEGGVELNG